MGQSNITNYKLCTVLVIGHTFSIDVAALFNQSIKVICSARNVVHKLESEARNWTELNCWEDV